MLAPARRAPQLILATANPHKVEELRAIFERAAAEVRLRSLADFPNLALSEPAEIGNTFEANATIKAFSYAAQLSAAGVLEPNDLVLGDDSGIEIDALALPNGAPRPGVISSHYATDGTETGISRAVRDAANNARVLHELDGAPSESRAARFVCVMALGAFIPPPRGRGRGGGLQSTSDETRATSPALLHLTRGTFEGRIGIPPRVPAGNLGFGYDPLFLLAPDFTHTSAELPRDQKNQVSHRARAAAEMAAWLQSTRSRT